MCGVALLAFGIKERRRLQINDVSTDATPEYPKVRSRVYAADIPTVRAAAQAACASLPRWHEVRGGGSELHIEVTTLLFGFVDDVTVRFESLEGGHTRVAIRSHSRVGKGDLGENARHIALLQSAMDRRLRTTPTLTE